MRTDPFGAEIHEEPKLSFAKGLRLYSMGLTAGVGIAVGFAASETIFVAPPPVAMQRPFPATATPAGWQVAPAARAAPAAAPGPARPRPPATGPMPIVLTSGSAIWHAVNEQVADALKDR